MRSRFVPFALLALLPSTTFAQSPLKLSSFNLELRGEVAVPTAEMDEQLDLKTGFGFGVAAKYSVARPLAIYLGWDRFRFNGATSDFAARVVDRGFRLGLQAGIPQPDRRVRPFATAGAVFNRASLELRDSTATHDFRADRSAGYELGGGLRVPVAQGIWVVPEARYRAHASSWNTTLLTDPEIDISYLALNLGVVIRIPRSAPNP